MTQENLDKRITIDSEQCGGRPCVRGMRIRVSDVLDLLASGLSYQQVLDEMPDITEEDINACLAYAARSIDHPTLLKFFGLPAVTLLPLD